MAKVIDGLYYSESHEFVRVEGEYGYIGITDYAFVSYSEHAVGEGADSKALSYIQLKNREGKTFFGVGMDGNISLASIKGIICAINRATGEKKKQ